MFKDLYNEGCSSAIEKVAVSKGWVRDRIAGGLASRNADAGESILRKTLGEFGESSHANHLRYALNRNKAKFKSNQSPMQTRYTAHKAGQDPAELAGHWRQSPEASKLRSDVTSINKSTDPRTMDDLAVSQRTKDEFNKLVGKV